jgi:hypothetical protein
MENPFCASAGFWGERAIPSAGSRKGRGPFDAWKSFSTNQTILCFTTPIVCRAAAQFHDWARSAGFFRRPGARFGSIRAEGKSGVPPICALPGTFATV